MGDLLLGLAAALLASALYALGIALQALEARSMPVEHSLRLSLLKRLVKRRRWLAGTALGLVGWGVQTVALMFAPLTLVQPTLAAGLVFLLLLGTRMLGERPGRHEVTGVLAIAVGVVGLGLTAPDREPSHAGGIVLIVALAAVGAVALAPYALSLARRRSPALLVAAGAGVAYAWDGMATKFASDELAAGLWLGFLLWGVAMSVAAGFGTLSEMSALQRRPAIQVAPIVFALTTIVPVALAPALAHESWGSSPARAAAIATSLGLVLAGAIAIARSPLVGALLGGEARAAADEARGSAAAAAA